MSGEPESQSFEYTARLRGHRLPPAPGPVPDREGEQGVLLVEPYKSELLPHWKFKTVAEAKKSSAKIYKLFLAYLRA